MKQTSAVGREVKGKGQLLYTYLSLNGIIYFVY